MQRFRWLRYDTRLTLGSRSHWNAVAAAWAAPVVRGQAQLDPLSAAIIANLPKTSGTRFLDLASGTGNPALFLAEQLRDIGEVVCVDSSENMLAFLKQAAKKQHIVNAIAVLGAIESLPFASACFDVVTCRLGLMFAEPLSACVSEIFRVSKPGATISISVFGPIRSNLEYWLVQRVKKDLSITECFKQKIFSLSIDTYLKSVFSEGFELINFTPVIRTKHIGTLPEAVNFFINKHFSNIKAKNANAVIQDYLTAHLNSLGRDGGIAIKETFHVYKFVRQTSELSTQRLVKWV